MHLVACDIAVLLLAVRFWYNPALCDMGCDGSRHRVFVEQLPVPE